MTMLQVDVMQYCYDLEICIKQSESKCKRSGRVFTPRPFFHVSFQEAIFFAQDIYPAKTNILLHPRCTCLPRVETRMSWELHAYTVNDGYLNVRITFFRCSSLFEAP
jgi:hypothetical protein